MKRSPSSKLDSTAKRSAPAGSVTDKTGADGHSLGSCEPAVQILLGVRPYDAAGALNNAEKLQRFARQIGQSASSNDLQVFLRELQVTVLTRKRGSAASTDNALADSGHTVASTTDAAMNTHSLEEAPAHAEVAPPAAKWSGHKQPVAAGPTSALAQMGATARSTTDKQSDIGTSSAKANSSNDNRSRNQGVFPKKRGKLVLAPAGTPDKGGCSPTDLLKPPKKAPEKVTQPSSQSTAAKWKEPQPPSGTSLPTLKASLPIRIVKSKPTEPSSKRPPVPVFREDTPGASTQTGHAYPSSSNLTASQPSTSNGTCGDANTSSECKAGTAENIAQSELDVLIAGLSEKHLMRDGMLDKDRLHTMAILLLEGVAKSSADWAKVWQSMRLPEGAQPAAISLLLSIGFTGNEHHAKAIPGVVADLVKAHRVKLRSMEAAMQEQASALTVRVDRSETAKHIFAQIFAHIFPRPKRVGWGWSRLGWSWSTWWACVGHCLQTATPKDTSDILTATLVQYQEKGKTPLLSQDSWDNQERVEKVREFLLARRDIAEGDLDVQLAARSLNLSFNADAAVNSPPTAPDGHSPPGDSATEIADLSTADIPPKV